MFTACGELKEMLDGLDPARHLSAEGIAQTCEWKTAYYSFACPLVTGATLGGASQPDIDALYRYALSVGLAFQIRDDVMDLSDNGTEAPLGDLREGKLTLPLWYAIQHGSAGDRARLASVLNGGTRTRRAAESARRVIVRAGGVEFAKQAIARHAGEVRGLLGSLGMAEACRQQLARYTDQLLALPVDGIQRRHNTKRRRTDHETSGQNSRSRIAA